MSKPFVRADVEMFLAFLNNIPGPKMHEMAPADARAMMVGMRAVADVEVGALGVIKNIAIPGPAGTIPARLYDVRPARSGPTPVMVFFHGGGFVIGDLDTHEPYCAEAARQLDLPVIAVDYRLAPEHPFPAGPDDAEAAARWIASSPDIFDFTVTGLIPSGDSAGGNLAIVTTMALRDHPAAVPVILQHPIYPVVSEHGAWPSMAAFADGFLLTAQGMSWFTNAYASDPNSWRAAPLRFNHVGMPPSFVTTASLDPLRDQGHAYVAALEAAGVHTLHREAEGNIHGHINLAKGIPSSADDIRSNLTMLKTMLAKVMAPA